MPKSPVISRATNPYIERESNVPGRQVCYQLHAYPVLTSTRTSNAYAVTEDQLDELTTMVSQMTLSDPPRYNETTTTSPSRSRSSSSHPNADGLGRYESHSKNHKTGESQKVLRSARLARK